MTRLVDLHTPPLMTVVRRGALALGAVAALGLGLSGCGGGDQVKTFTPSKIVSFGDEASVLASVAVGSGQVDGLKYSVNFLSVERGVRSQFVPALQESDDFSATQWAETYGAWYPSAPEVGSPTVVAGTGNSVVRRRFTMDVVYTPSGASSTVTNTDATVGFDYLHMCTENRLWIQLLANAYDLGYRSQCGLDRDGAVTYAEAGAKVDDVASQVTTHYSELNDSTLVTMLAGQNDILEAYDSADATAVAAAALKLKGQQLGGVINRIIQTGARVLVVTVPDLSYSPYARAGGDAGRARMAALVAAFNDGLIGSGGVKNDGHFIGRVKGYEQVRYMTEDASAYRLVNVTSPVCDPAKGRTPAGAPDDTSTLYCNSTSLVDGGSSLNYLWADDFNLGPAFHASLGNLAFIRARDNPF